MKLIFKLLGIFMFLFGILILINPDLFFGWIEDNLESKMLYIFAIVTRLVFGILLIIAAEDSKFPNGIKVFGLIVIIAAIIFIFIGQAGFQNFVAAMLPFTKSTTSVSGLFGIALGGFFIYAFSKKEIK